MRALRVRPARRLRRLLAVVLIGGLTTAAAMPTAFARPPSPRGVDDSSHRVVSRAQEMRGTPVAPTPRTVRQPDGSPITLITHGDSRRLWTTTTDGHTVVRDAAGRWRYATSRTTQGQPAASGPVVGRAAPPAASAGLTPTRDQSAPLRSGTRFTQALGTQHSLVILVSFTDRPSVGSTPADWAARFFGGHDSVASYYRTASYGHLDLQPASETSGAPDGVVGWIGLPYAHPDYRGMTDAAQIAAEQKVTRDAISAADEWVDYGAFDTNGDGTLKPSELHITVIAAGYETAFSPTDTCGGPSIWGHGYTLGDPYQAKDAHPVAVGSGYTTFGEWHCSTGTSPGVMATLGIMVHEFGHDLGWPDLYDLDGSSAGVGVWSVMSHGTWTSTTGPIGSAPTLPDAWLKSLQGWLDPLPAAPGRTPVTIGAAEGAASTYRLGDNDQGVDWNWGTAASGEYFLVENRQPVGLDAALPGCGLLIYHVDESRANNADDHHRLLDVEEADGRDLLTQSWYSGSAGDPWPGTAGSSTFSASSTPNSLRYDGTPSGVSIEIPAGSGCSDAMPATLALPPPNGVGTFHPVTPARLLDTRNTAGVAAGGILQVPVTARAGLPDTGVGAVVVNVTAVQPAASGFVTVYPAGTVTPGTSNLNVVRGVPAVAALAVVPPGERGAIAIRNQAGRSHFVVDVVGWYAADGGPMGVRYTAQTPARFLDTRATRPLGAAGMTTVPVAGRGGIPADATAVVLNLTTTGATRDTWLKVFPAGLARPPITSNLNVRAGETRANLVYSPLGARGSVVVRNEVGSAQAIVDVVGWFGPTGAFVYHPTSPFRAVDSRTGSGTVKAPLGPRSTRAVTIASATSRVPVEARGIVANVTATNTTAASWLTVHPDTWVPAASNLNWSAGQSVPNLASTGLGGGSVRLTNAQGRADVIVDIHGWYTN